MQGLVIKSLSGEFTVFSNKQKFVCKPKGLFKLTETLVKVGDQVIFDQESKTINEVLPRKNELIRPAIVNIDKIFLVFSVKEPDLNLNLLDRLLSLFEFYNLPCIIVFTKLDLVANTNDVEPIIQYYQKIGYKVYTTANEFNLSAIKQEISQSICAFAGQSGVGKSSLLNIFDETFQIKTDFISQALGRGKHTTRHVELLPLLDGWVADTPGFGTVEFPFEDLLTFSQTFVEFFKNAHLCRFPKCLHLEEPQCHIKQMVKNNEILSSRYENYVLFAKEIKENIKNKY
ncbi:MAG: ribosome small subunit-dependent GTPase A [Bacilli bacterium]